MLDLDEGDDVPATALLETPSSATERIDTGEEGANGIDTQVEDNEEQSNENKEEIMGEEKEGEEKDEEDIVLTEKDEELIRFIVESSMELSSSPSSSESNVENPFLIEVGEDASDGDEEIREKKEEEEKEEEKDAVETQDQGKVREEENVSPNADSSAIDDGEDRAKRKRKRRRKVIKKKRRRKLGAK